MLAQFMLALAACFVLVPKYLKFRHARLNARLKSTAQDALVLNPILHGLRGGGNRAIVVLITFKRKIISLV